MYLFQHLTFLCILILNKQVFGKWAKSEPKGVVGSERVFNCSHDHTSQIQWQQEFSKDKLIFGPILNGVESKLTMQLEDFDDNTAAICNLIGARPDGSKEFMRYPIYVSTGNSLSPTYYNETSEIKYDCKNLGEIKEYKYLISIQDNVIKTIINYTGPINPTFAKEDSRSILCCIYFTKRNKHEVVRHVSNKIMYVYKPDLHIREQSTTTSPITSSSTLKPEPQTFEIGKDVVFNCSHNFDSKFSSENEWKQVFPIDNLTIKYKPNINGKEYILRLRLQEFDNHTTLTCQQNHTIIFLPTNLTSGLYINEKYYNEETVDSDCNKYAHPNYLIQVDANKHITVLSPNMKKNFNRADKIDLFCMYFKAENEYEVTRYVKKINWLRYQKKSELVWPPDNNFKVYFYIGGAMIGLMILIIIFFLWKRRQCCNKSKQRAESEDVNANAGQVTYAELELRPVSNNTPTVEETPYAEIIPYQSYLDRGNKRPEYTESPYANC